MKLRAAVIGILLASSAFAVDPSAGEGDDSYPHRITGQLVRIDSSTLSLRIRSGATVPVEYRQAVENQLSGLLVVGNAYVVRGDYDQNGTLKAAIITRAKGSDELWPRDR